jgi:hypothetical protein
MKGVGDEGRGALWARSLRGSDRGVEPSRGGATVWNRPSHGRQDGEALVPANPHLNSAKAVTAPISHGVGFTGCRFR